MSTTDTHQDVAASAHRTSNRAGRPADLLAHAACAIATLATAAEQKPVTTHQVEAHPDSHSDTQPDTPDPTRT